MVKIDSVTLHLLQEFSPREFGGIVATAGDAPEEQSAARMTERCAHVADDVSQLVARGLRAVENLVVRVFDVPIAHQDHHYLQPLELSGAHKRIVGPLPVTYALNIVGSRFKSDVRECSFTRNCDGWYQVIDLRLITDTP